MHTLTLMRHAKSSWSDPELGDLDRPLNGRGKKAAREMGYRLQRAGYRPDRIITSTATRAVSSAKRLISCYDSAIALSAAPSLYEASVDDYVQSIRECDESVKRLMVIGHNPVIEQLVEQLAGQRYSMPTAAYVQFEIPGEWKAFVLQRYRVFGYDFPKSDR